MDSDVSTTVAKHEYLATVVYGGLRSSPQRQNGGRSERNNKTGHKSLPVRYEYGVYNLWSVGAFHHY